MDDPAHLAPPAFTGQRVEDVVRRLHVVSRFAALTGSNMALALEMERDFIFGIMPEDRPTECMALYDFIIRKVDFPPSPAADQKRVAGPTE